MKVLHQQQPREERARDYGPALEYGFLYQQGQAIPLMEPGSVYERDARRIIEAKQALRKAQISVAPSRYVITPYMSRAEGVAWYAKQEESSHPQHFEHEWSERQHPSQEQFVRREHTKVHVHPSQCNLSQRLGHGGDRRLGVTSKHSDMPSVLEVGPVCPAVLKIGNSSERGSLSRYSTPFSREILEAPHLSMVKIPSIELFDRTTDPDDHLNVYKAQMYV